MAEDTSSIGSGSSGGGSASALFDSLSLRTRELQLGADAFARSMTRAFASSVTSGKQLDDVLKSLALRLSDLSLRMALQPLTRGLAAGINHLFAGLAGAAGAVKANALGAVKPFAAGGVIGTPTYFPLATGGVGLAGEAGPEAILPLRRGADGRLGVTASGAPATSITINIATPDAESFRRSETYVAGQIARAVARGQRSL
jgi:phage-related minor tail protein